jgi:hypothetical protein
MAELVSHTPPQNGPHQPVGENKAIYFVFKIILAEFFRVLPILLKQEFLKEA